MSKALLKVNRFSLSLNDPHTFVNILFEEQLCFCETTLKGIRSVLEIITQIITIISNTGKN